MIKVSNLTKKYGSVYAVRDVSFEVSTGEIVGFLGPNGAGKTTTMNMITGYLSSTSGAIEIDGFDILEQPSKAKARLGYLPEQPPLYIDMTVDEYLSFVYELKGCLIPKNEHLCQVCELTGITGVRKRLIKNLSKGYRQRVGIAQALICSPPVLILDEPTVGLDPSQIIEIRSLIKQLGRKHTIILSSHILSEVQAVCDRIIVLNRGRVVADSNTLELGRALGGGDSLSVLIEAPEGECAEVLKRISGVSTVERRGEREKGVYEYLLTAESGKDIRRDTTRAISERGWLMLGMRTEELSLEEIFIKLTNEEGEVTGNESSN